MAEIANPKSSSGTSKRRVPFLDTVFVRGLVWTSTAFVLIAPIAAPRLIAPAAMDHPSLPAAAMDRPALETAEPDYPSPAAAASEAQNSTITYTHPPRTTNVELVSDRLAAILGAYRPSPDDFGTPASGAQAAGALQWCAHQIARYEHASVLDARSALSAALIEPRSAAGLRVVNAIEAPAQGADETLRMQCASLLYVQLQR